MSGRIRNCSARHSAGPRPPTPAGSRCCRCWRGDLQVFEFDLGIFGQQRQQFVEGWLRVAVCRPAPRSGNVPAPGPDRTRASAPLAGRDARATTLQRPERTGVGVVLVIAMGGAGGAHAHPSLMSSSGASAAGSSRSLAGLRWAPQAGSRVLLPWLVVSVRAGLSSKACSIS